MKLYWLIGLPLVAAAIVYSVRTQPCWAGRTQRILTVGLSLVTALACACLSFALPPNEVVSFLGQQWALDPVAQGLLACLYMATAILLAIAATTEQGGSFCAPALASAGLLSGVILLRSLLLSFMLLPIALLVLVLAAPLSASSMRGAARFLAVVTLPIPLLLACFALLERFALFPDEIALAGLSAVLVVPAVALWLTLFPFHAMTRLWAAGSVPLAPAFLWVVKDWVVMYLLLALWRQNPALHTEIATLILSTVGLVTAVVSGVWAYIQADPSTLLACAAMSELGIAVQGIMASSTEGLVGALFLLVSRSAAVLLASSALAALRSIPAKGNRTATKPLDWRALFLLLAFAVGILALAGVPPLGGFLGRKQIYAAVLGQDSYLLLAWLSASLGILLGLARTGWSLWHTQWQSPLERVPALPFLLIMGLFLLCLWLGLHPQPVTGVISDLARPLLPLFPL